MPTTTYTAHASPFTLNAPTAPWPIIEGETDETRAARRSRWERHGHLYIGGIGLAATFAVALLTSAYYFTAASASELTGVLMAIAIIVGALTSIGMCTAAAVLWITGLRFTAVHEHIDRVASQNATAAYAVDALRQDLHGAVTYGQMQQLLDRAVQRYADQTQAADERLGTIERRLDDLNEEYERGWVDGAAQTAEALSAKGNGKVHQIHSPPPRTRPH